MVDKIVETVAPWPFSVDRVDRSIIISNYHYLLDHA